MAKFGKAGSGQVIIDPSTGAKIQGGNYIYTGNSSGSGMEIDLAKPTIKYGTGNFEIDEYGNIIDNVNPILGYSIHGITVLGLEYNPSIRGTEIKVKQFVESNNSDIELKGVRIEVKTGNGFTKEVKNDSIELFVKVNNQNYQIDSYIYRYLIYLINCCYHHQ